MGRLFVLSQSGDMTGGAGRIVERLRQRFGAATILQNLGPAPLGADLRAVAAGALSQCDAAVVIIGPVWTSGADAEGRRRWSRQAR